MPALRGHIRGDHTLGHYLLGTDDRAKLFVLDIDLNKTGILYVSPEGATDPEETVPLPVNPREDWQNRADPYRTEYKMLMREISNQFARMVHTHLGIPVGIAYSGYKGMHVYGFTGSLAAAEVREAGRIIMEAAGWIPSRGYAFFSPGETVNPDFNIFTIEVYPKQDSIEGKDLGNLVKLPCGVDQRSKVRSFFIDTTAPYSVLQPHPDQLGVLDTGNPWM